MVVGVHARLEVVAEVAVEHPHPGLSGTMSATSICAGLNGITSVRFLPHVTTLPCQCRVWKLKRRQS